MAKALTPLEADIWRETFLALRPKEGVKEAADEASFVVARCRFSRVTDEPDERELSDEAAEILGVVLGAFRKPGK